MVVPLPRPYDDSSRVGVGNAAGVTVVTVFITDGGEDDNRFDDGSVLFFSSKFVGFVGNVDDMSIFCYYLCLFRFRGTRWMDRSIP